MFIERLTKQDICNYFNALSGAQKFGVESVRNFKAKGGKLVFTFNNVNYVATDFNCANSKKDASQNENWLEFLYKKFGKEYADAFFEHRQRRKEISIENATKKVGFKTEMPKNLVYEDLVR